MWAEDWMFSWICRFPTGALWEQNITSQLRESSFSWSFCKPRAGLRWKQEILPGKVNPSKLRVKEGGKRPCKHLFSTAIQRVQHSVRHFYCILGYKFTEGSGNVKTHKIMYFLLTNLHCCTPTCRGLLMVVTLLRPTVSRVDSCLQSPISY